MTEFEVINRFVDVDGVRGSVRIIRSNVFFVNVDGTLSDFMLTILVNLFCDVTFPK